MARRRRRSQDHTTLIPEVVTTAKKRFELCEKWESYCRANYKSDNKFAEGDAYNGYQWPDNIRQGRMQSNRPCLTINKVRQHNLQILNDSKQNKPEIRVSPTGNGATYDAAQAWQQLIRRIEYQSNASVAYQTAAEFQVKAGFGYWRVLTEYADTDSFDQDIFIRRIENPLNVYLDPDIKEFDGSDARFGFVFQDVPKDEFNAEYPEFAGRVPPAALGNMAGWWSKDYVRVAEYFVKEQVRDTLVLVLGEDGQEMQFLLSTIPPALRKETLAGAVKSRDVIRDGVKYYLITGMDVLEEQDWAGKYIPIVRVIGEETIIEGQLDRKGHTRALVDAQRMYNYWTSSAVEYGALQGKTPWVGPAEAFEDNETQWKTANVINHPYLPYKHVDENGQPIPPPTRSPAPESAPAYMAGMQVASGEMMAVSGQYAPQMGEPSNERSGKALMERQRKGDNATYHFIDNLATAIRFTGKILLDLVPKIYDTTRWLKIMAEDGTEMEVKIDPNAQQAFQQKLDNDGQVVERILNPSLGKYDVIADVGPGFSTKREEAFNAMTLILTQAPQLVGIIGDLLFKSGDFPLADEAAQRLKRMVPAQALGQGPSQEVQQLQQQVQMMGQMLEEQLSQSAMDKIKLTGKDQLRNTDAFKAETERLNAVAKNLPPEQLTALLRPYLRQLLANMPPDGLEAVEQATTEGIVETEAVEAPPILGAKKAPDGHWYTPGKEVGQWNKVVPGLELAGGMENG